MPSEYFGREVTADDVFQEPPRENNRMIELAFSTENDPKFCQVCESMDFLIDISRDISVTEEFGRMLVNRDERVESVMKYLCLECDAKVCGMIDLKKQYITTYHKVLARMECAKEIEAQWEEVVVSSPEEELFAEAADIEMHEDSHNEIDPVAENASEDNRMCTKDTQMDKVSTFTCHYCNKNYKYKAALRTHVVNHVQQEKSMKGPSIPQKGNLIHICTICGYNAKFRSVLKQHMLFHTGEKPHKCFKCGKGFTLKSDLNKHMIIHTNEKPFICGICSTSFNRMSILKTHMMIHVGQKPFICGSCSSAFHHKGDLKRHMMIHTGEKPHKCPKCDKNFARKDHLNQHMRRLHPKD